MRTRFLCIFVFFVSFLGAQTRTIKKNDLVWLGDFTKVQLNKNWSVYLDCGLRRTEWLNKWSQILVRPGITYNLRENVSITAGFAWFDHFSGSLARKEWRGWQQLLFTENYGRLKVSHRLRVEQRFNQTVENNRLTDVYRYNTRYRYHLSVQMPLNKRSLQDRTLYIGLSDEVMINSGREIIYNYFDQNRAAVGLGYKWSEKLNVSICYMNDFIQRNQARTFENNNVIVINFYHNFKLNAANK
jgi:long-subunit fatty acid transport protein